MSFEIRQAARQTVKALVGFYGKSGSGKTMSAILFARGLVGPTGNIILIDSENGRGSIFSDIIPGGYKVIDLDAPFSPERYVAAIEAAEKSGADAIVIDSMSHEWSGEGGVQDMHEDAIDRMTKNSTDWQQRERMNWPAWREPKMQHKLMVNRLLRAKTHMICCLRGEEKSHIEKNENGKNTIVVDKFSSPVFDPRFVFEMLINFETINRDGQGGFVRVVKTTHPSIASLLPKPDQQVSIQHGAALAQWCKAPGATPVTQPDEELKKQKARLWDELKPIRGVDKSWKVAQQYLYDECLMDPGENVQSLTAPELSRLADMVREKLKVGIVP